ncbi:uncharacterized protein LOC142338311 [Convolutriloba macropyga]|uniref:uncharacterized protein LOC142338311 n=1 Tax=Convolutriloba macropyga TaxID=536237 RepID=UPI003F524E35
MSNYIIKWFARMQLHFCRRIEFSTTSSCSKPCVLKKASEETAKQISDEHRKEELIDEYGRVHNYLRISLTEKCNLRCQYCMPAEGVSLTPSAKLISPEEHIYLASYFVKVFGTRKIRLTGGEPLLQPNLVRIIHGMNLLKNDGLESIGMTSNGIALESKLESLKQSGLDRLNISLGTLHEEKYSFITRRKGLKLVWNTIWEAIRLSMFPLKINCVVMRGLNDEEVENFVALTQNYPIDIRFIEYIPFSGNKWRTSKLVPMHESLDRICSKFSTIKRLKNDRHDTAKSFQVDGFVGTFGFISSMSNHFCAGCNRLRITADGNLKVCLFDTNEVSLRDVIRNEQLTPRELHESIKKTVSAAVKLKNFSHGGRTDEINSGKLDQGNRSMILIGG